MPPGSFEEIEHTADWAIRVQASDLASLFETAARGMYHLLVDLDALSRSSRFEVTLEAGDAETLLVDWLNELLYLTERHGILFREFRVEPLAGEPLRLRARVQGGPTATPCNRIKAVTFSGLEIRSTPNGYQTELVFDV